jgi:hypothetical protein
MSIVIAAAVSTATFVDVGVIVIAADVTVEIGFVISIFFQSTFSSQ